jgi:hypothetical protein
MNQLRVKDEASMDILKGNIDNAILITKKLKFKSNRQAKAVEEN